MRRVILPTLLLLAGRSEAEQIAGRVVDWAGEPIAGAQVAAVRDGSTSWAFDSEPVSEHDPCGGPIAGERRVTGSAGDFAIDVAPGEPCDLAVRVPGRPPMVFPATTMVLAGAVLPAIDLVIPEPVDLEGVLRESDGRTVAGVEVTALARSRWITCESIAVTDSAGRFIHRGLPAWTAAWLTSLCASGHSEHGVALPAKGTVRVDITRDVDSVVRPGVVGWAENEEIRGRVTRASGVPAAGAVVTVYPSDGANPTMTTCSADGTFTAYMTGGIRRAWVGSAWARLPGEACLTTVVDGVAECVLAPAAIVDVDCGSPGPVLVTSRTSPAVQALVSPRAGRLRLELPAGEWTLGAPDSILAPTILRLQPGETTHVGLPPARDGAFRVRVTDTNGRPVEGAFVSVGASTVEQGRWLPEITGPDGRADFWARPRGALARIDVTHPEFSPKRELVVIDEDLDLVLERPACLEARVADEHGKPASGIRVELHEATSRPQSALRALPPFPGHSAGGMTDAGGSVTVCDGPGSRLVVIDPASPRPRAVPCELKAGATASASFVLPSWHEPGPRKPRASSAEAAQRAPGARVSGVVKDSDGRTSPEVMVAGCRDWTWTDDNGGFVCELVAGRRVLTAERVMDGALERGHVPVARLRASPVVVQMRRVPTATVVIRVESIPRGVLATVLVTPTESELPPYLEWAEGPGVRVDGEREVVASGVALGRNDVYVGAWPNGPLWRVGRVDVMPGAPVSTTVRWPATGGSAASR